MNTTPSAKTSTSLPLASRWHIGLLAASLISIALHFALGGANLPAVFRIAATDIPLLAVIIIGGIPLLIQIGTKLFKGSVGADFLGAIELIAAALLDQYLAAILIIIMLSACLPSHTLTPPTTPLSVWSASTPSATAGGGSS